MGWTDNREQGLTGRKRPCAPRSSQLQTSITMIIYPLLTKCTVSMFHQRPVNRHRTGKFMGTGSQGQVGKRASHWWLPSKGGKKQRKEKSVFCPAERTIYYRAFAEDSICCLLLARHPPPPPPTVACLNGKWEYMNQGLVEDRGAWSHESFGCFRGHRSEQGGIRCDMLLSPFNLSFRGWPGQLVCMLGGLKLDSDRITSAQRIACLFIYIRACLFVVLRLFCRVVLFSERIVEFLY